MARLFGFLANQTDRIRCALTREAAGVALPSDARVDGWGVGSYQGGEVLLRKRPGEQQEPVDFLDLVRDLRTDAAIIHVRAASVGQRTLDNTHPFRFRQWLFAHNGKIDRFDEARDALLERLPDFLARNIRGETDSEVIFATFLSFVWETGRLDDPEVDRKLIAQALAQTVTAIDAITDARSLPRATLNCIVTNRFAMVALRRGLPMSWLKRTGIRDCAVCRKQPETTGREPKRMDHDALRYVMVASDHANVPSDWFEVPANPRGALLAIDRGLDVQVVEL
jgi:predicted glutamine amidotransferase